MVAAILARKDLTVFQSMPLRFSFTLGAHMNMTIAHLKEMFQATIVVWELFKEITYCLFCHELGLAQSSTCV